jgi:acyl-coenzyme A thioesterase PaaI-like protein
VLVAIANETTATKRLAFYDVGVRRGDDLVASFRGTVYRTDQAFFSETE